LVVATQGRSFYIFDELPLVHQMMDAAALKAIKQAKLFRT